jgi:hypothetical protein
MSLFSGLRRWGNPDPTRLEQRPDDVEWNRCEPEPDDAVGLRKDKAEGPLLEGSREPHNVVGSLRKPNGIERGPREPGDLEGSPCDDRKNSRTPKRRALLVGISYKYSPPDRDGRQWEELDGHRDVERFRALLLSEHSLPGYFAFVTALGANPHPRYLQIPPRRYHRT